MKTPILEAMVRGTSFEAKPLPEARMTRILIIPAVSALLCLFMAGCKPSSQSAAPATGSPSSDRIASNGGPSGPTDGVGGNGILGKIYESYKVDPQTLKAYTEILKPIFEHLNKIETIDYGDGNVDAGLPMEEMFKAKTWYLIPSALKTIDAKVLGVKFIDQKTEQFALQTENEVWLDKNLVEKMSLKDQARLLLHEFFMIYYTNKFVKPSDLCKKSPELKKFICDVAVSRGVEPDSGWSVESFRPLQERDYQNVRRFTAEIFDNGTTISKEAFEQLLRASEFYSKEDSERVNVTKSATDKNGKERQLQMKQVPYEQLLQKAEAEGLPFDQCYFLKEKVTRPCHLEVAKVKDGQYYSVSKLVVTVTDSETLQALFIQNGSDFKVGAPIFEDGSTNFNLDPQAEGRVNNVFFTVFNYLSPLPGVDVTSSSLSMADMELKAIQLKPNIIRKVETAAQIGNTESLCTFSSLQKIDRGVVIFSSKMSAAEKAQWIKNADLRSATESGSFSCP